MVCIPELSDTTLSLRQLIVVFNILQAPMTYHCGLVTNQVTLLCSVQVLKKASEKQALVEVALNTHGTRAVQKLIETLSSPEQVLSWQPD